MPLQRFVALPGYVSLAGAIVLALAWPAAVDTARYWPLLASLVLLGLPHGAVDHHVPERLGAPSRRAPLLIWYVALTAAGIALWWIAPWMALALFLVVAAVHWGTGDVWFALSVSARAGFLRPWRVAAFVATRGLLPVALPLLIHPSTAAEGTGAILRAVGVEGAGWAPSGVWRLAGLIAVAVAVAAAVAASVLDHRGSPNPRAMQIDVAEILLLTLTMLVVPPVFAVGVYFIAWHSARHVARLMMSSPAQARLIDAGRVPAALLAWHREAASMTFVSLAGLGLLAALVWRMPLEPDAVVGSALALIAALTLPHALVVAWMDRVQLRGYRVRGSATGRAVTRGRASRSGPAFSPPADRRVARPLR